MFWRQFGATGHLRTFFSTSFSLLTKVAKFKKNDSCAQCFDATFGQQNSSARSFGQVLACYQKKPSSSKSIVAQSVLTPISSNRTVAHGLYFKVKLFNKICQFQAKRKLRRVFWRQFRAIGQLRTVFWTSFISLSKDAKFKQIDNCAECFDANLEQQDSCARCFGQVLDFNRSRQFQAERKLRRLFWRQFQWTGQLRTVFWTSFRF